MNHALRTLLWLPLVIALPLALIACGGDDSDDHGLTSGNGDVLVTASGEVLALGGYTFPPVTADDPAFVDGWNVTFEKLLVVVDNVTFSANPDTSPTDQSLYGRTVASTTGGPWAIDLHKGGPITGKGGSDEQAIRLETVDGAPFDATERYAFSYDTVAASDAAVPVQVDEGDSDYAAMVSNGWSVLYVGTATFNGTTCTSADSTFDYTQLPSTVHFRFGFASPSSYLNCQNPDNDPAEPLGDEEHQRGVQVKANSNTIAQVTVHTDHPFWASFIHDAQLRFDPLAALATRDADGAWQVTLADAVGVDYHAFEYNGAPLPWRSCLSGQTWPAGDTQVGYEDLGATVADFAAFMTYNQSTQGHLNADGLCFVQRNYESVR